MVAIPAASASGNLRIEPDGIVLSGPGATQRLIVTAPDSRGAAHDLTADCEWGSSDESILHVDGPKVVAKSPGEAQVTARCDERGGQLTVAVRASGTSNSVGLDFATDLVSILTIKGCNGSACHGSPAGQAGFKLSLFGADPQADHRMIVAAQEGRRVNLDRPAESLILQKPTFQIAHGGGHLMTPDSDAYRTILSWLKQGAGYGGGAAQLEKLEMVPAERILVGPGATQRLVVVGRLSDSTTVDMTDRVRYQVLDEAVVSPIEGAELAAANRGRTSVLARGMGKTAASEFFVIERPAGPDFKSPEPKSFVDEHVFAKLRRVNVPPHEPSSDQTFVRRVFLDAIGMLPKAEEAQAFALDPRPDKRSRLIDDLLDREDYARHWQVKLEDWFRNSQYYSQGRTNGSFKRWLRELVAHDKPYDRAVREMLTATGDTTIRPAGNFWHPAMDFMLKKFEINKAVPTVTRLFLGKRIECAECHNHPLENLTQDDFYGMAAFLARTRVKHGYGQYRRVWYDDRRGEVLHPATKEPVAPKYLEGEAAVIEPGATRRQALAAWIVEDQQMQFARATVNRIWYEYFGRGIVEPFDDFRSTNRATHPELLDALARHFIDGGFRFKSLHRLILNSKTYQLSAHSSDRPGGLDPLEDALFARYVPRKIPAEALLDAVIQVTDVPHEFRGYPVGTSPKDLFASIGAPQFLTTFGFPRRDVMETRAQAPSMAQALHLMNSDGLRQKIEAEGNILGMLIADGSADAQIVEELYLTAYSRPPTEAESVRLAAFLTKEAAAGRSRRRALENVLWALLNSKEFQLNR